VSEAARSGVARIQRDAGQTIRREETYFVATTGTYHHTMRLSVT
jgi:hypothetical protein